LNRFVVKVAKRLDSRARLEAAQMRKRPCPNDCCCAALTRRLEEIEARRVRREADDFRQWDRTFGAAAQRDRKLRDERIIHAASIQAFLDFLSKRP
jgi:hypothetical protein